MAILCSLQNLNLSFGEKTIFKDAKLSINVGDKIGLIGLNGHGKSTLFNILAEELRPDISTPGFIFDKNNKNFDLFYIPQELDLKSFPDLNIKNYYLAFYPELLKVHRELTKVQDELALDYSNEKLLDKQQNLLEAFENNFGWEIENNYLNYIQFFELQDEDKNLELLSGGEQRKMALSIGLSARAAFILWDEPTNHLDMETIEKFEDELNSTQKTFMIISHDRYLLNHVTNKIVHIERGNINTFIGTYLEYLEYLEEREKELQKNLDKLQNRHRRELAWMRQGIKARGTRSKKRVEGFENIKANIGDLKSRSKKVVDLSLFHSGRKTKQLFEITDGKFSYNDKKELFKGLNLVINKKDKIALIGPNGAGKTTFLNLLNDTLQLTDGEMKRADDLKIITFDQKRKGLDPTKSLLEIVGDGQDFVTLGNGKTQHVIAYLENFLFTKNQINQPVSTLSGGERNRLQLAMFMKQTADIWVFDEPTNDLDIETIELLEAELKSYESAVIIVGHDRAFLDNVCDSTWLLNDKDIEIFEGGYAQIAPYLHALELEKKLKEEEKKKAPKKDEATTEVKAQTKMTYKEKKRWDIIENEIAENDSSIQSLKESMASFDFSNPSEDLNKKFEVLTQELSDLENKSLSLMEEWEILSEKEY